MATINVSPTAGRSATHHLKLTSQSGTELGLICSDRRGNQMASVAVNPYPGMASQLRQGRSKYADRVAPFEDIPLDDFSGGLAMLHHDEDSSKYLDGFRVDTSKQGSVINGGLETYTAGLRDFDQNWSESVSWVSLWKDGTESKTTGFTSSAAYNMNSIVLLLRKVGAPTGTLTAQILNSADAVLKSKSLTIGTDCLTDLVSERVEFTFATVFGCADATAYKVKVSYAGANSDENNYVDVAVDGSVDLQYRVLDDTGDFKVLFTEYKDALYCITQPVDRSASKLYILGDRGVADDNTGALTTLIDGTRTGGAAWTVNEWAGSIVKILGDSKEEQPWRTIVSNTADTLTVSPAWTNVHTTNTEYVIVANKWKLKQTLNAYCYTTTNVSDKMYFGFGLPSGVDTYIYRLREFNKSGTWTEDLQREDNTSSGAVQLLGKNDEEGGLWKYPSSVVGDLWAYTLGQNPWSNLIRWKVMYKDIDNSNILGVLVPNDRAWIDTTYTNVTYDITGAGPIFVIGDSFGTGKIGHWKLDNPVDIRKAAALIMKFYISAGYVNDGDLQLILADGAGNEDEYNIYPNANVNGGTTGWQARYIFLDAPGAETADPSAITDIYLKVATDRGAAVVYFGGPFYLTGDRGDWRDRWQDFPMGTVCNGMELYAGGAGEIAENPWLLCNRGAYYIENAQIKKIPLGELEELEHPRSGEGHCVNEVYLYWNVGETIQRYYAGQLSSVGPDVDYGLPENRRGIPCSMASYPGKVFTAIDAGASGYSSVIFRRNHGWHEAYRGIAGNRIRSINAVARADSADRLYISEGADVLWVPISINPETESGYEYTHESVLETSRIYGGLRDTDKYYHAITLISEFLGTTNQYIEVDYRTSENYTWTRIGSINSSPRQRLSISSTNNVSGRWLQFRFRMNTNDKTVTPKIVSGVLDSLERLDVNNTYQYTVRLESGNQVNLADVDDLQTGPTKLAQLETWVNSPLPLTMNSLSNFEDNKLVFLDNLVKRVVYKKVDEIEQQVRIVDLTLIEVT